MGTGPGDRRHLVPGAIAIGIVAVLAVLAAGAVGAWSQAPASASSGSPSTASSASSANTALVALEQAPTSSARQQLCQSYLSDVASKLGVSEQSLESALLGAAGDTIDQMVKNGQISADAGALLKGRLQALQSPLCSNIPNVRAGAGKVGPFGGAARVLDPQALLDAAAGALGETRQQLLTEIGALKSGENLKTIAQNHNVSYSTVTTAVVTTAKSELDAAVKAGTITQTQEDALVSALQQRLDSGNLGIGGRGFGPMKGMMHGFGGMMGGFGHMFGGLFGGPGAAPANPVNPVPTATPGSIGG